MRYFINFIWVYCIDNVIEVFIKRKMLNRYIKDLWKLNICN